MEKAFQIVRARHAAARIAYQARVSRAGLTPLDDAHYAGPSLFGQPYHPITRDSWHAHRQLLELEGTLTEEHLTQIEESLRSIDTQEMMSQIMAELSDSAELPSTTVSIKSWHYRLIFVSEMKIYVEAAEL